MGERGSGAIPHGWLESLEVRRPLPVPSGESGGAARVGAGRGAGAAGSGAYELIPANQAATEIFTNPAPIKQADEAPIVAKSFATPDGLWPMARWERDRDDPLTIEAIAYRVSEGETLKQICKSQGWPKKKVWEWLCQDETRKASYEDALRCWADELNMETAQIAAQTHTGRTVKTFANGTQEVTEADMLGHRKLQIETNFKLSERLDRERFGPSRAKENTAGDLIDAGLLMCMGELLSKVKAVTARQEKVIEGSHDSSI